VPSLAQQSLSKLHLSAQANGFILFEVLVAMGLVATSWMALSNTYQGMILRLGQAEERGTALRKVMDQHELAILTAAQLSNSNQVSRKLADESIGMSRRARPIPGVSRTTHKK
jgi:type II secretory pathway pseudopilin PulG